MMKNLLLISVVLILLPGCMNQKVDQAEEAKKLMELSRKWAQAAKAGENEITLDYWTSDALMLPPGQALMKGHGDIREMLDQTSQIPGFQVNWEPFEAYVSESGDMGYVIAYNYFKIPDSLGNIVTTFGKGVEIWKKQDDGSWKCVVDIYNSDPSITSIKQDLDGNKTE
jgi:ketosteroid isomerase-like protein